MKRGKRHAIDNDYGRGIRCARRQMRADPSRRSPAGKRTPAGNDSGKVEFRITFYTTPDGQQPVADWLAELRRTQPMLEKLISKGLEKLRDSRRHGPPLTAQVDPERGIFELRVGRTNIARVFFYFRPGREIVVTNGYVKTRQKLDPDELERARTYQRQWEDRHP